MRTKFPALRINTTRSSPTHFGRFLEIPAEISLSRCKAKAKPHREKLEPASWRAMQQGLSAVGIYVLGKHFSWSMLVRIAPHLRKVYSSRRFCLQRRARMTSTVTGRIELRRQHHSTVSMQDFVDSYFTSRVRERNWLRSSQYSTLVSHFVR
jgi:hypothetical protein